MKFTKKQQGAVSVFLAIILLFTFIFSAVVVDGGRIYAAKNIVSGAGQLTLNAGLSNYDTALKDAYGLIAMSATPEDLQKNLKNYFVDSLSACGVTEEDYNTALVFLELAASEDSFSAERVEGTQICQGYVMEQQVLDYMKYRAPITVGSGILDKLKSVKSMKEAKKVADDEVQTTRAMSDVQGMLEELLDLVNAEVETSTGFSNTWEADLEQINKLCKGITAGELTIAGYEQYNQAGNAGDWEETINQFNTQYANLVSAMANADTVERNASAYDILLEMKGYYLTLKDVSEDSFMEFWCNKYNLNASAEDETDAEEGGETEDGETEGEADDGTEAAKQVGRQLYQQFASNKTEFLKVPEQIKTQVNNDISTVQNNAVLLYKAAETAKKKSEKVIKKIEKIEEKLNDIKEHEYKDWTEDITALSDENLKTQAQKSQEPFDELLEEDTGMDEMKTQVENNKDFFEKFMEYINNATFCNVKLKEVNSNKSAVKSEIDTHKGNAASGSALRTYVNSNNFSYLLSTANPQAKFSHAPIKDLSKTAFYTYLEDCCGKKKNNKEIDKANSEIQGTMQILLTQLEELFVTSDLTDVATKISEVQSELPSTALNCTGEEKEVNNSNTDIDDKSKRNETMDNALNTLNKDDTSLDGMLMLASTTTEAIIEPIYITEYVMNMYSYYTIDKTGKKLNDGTWEKKNEEKIVSLSDYKLYEDLIYRAEAEYILWGNKEDVRKNVGSTKAVIFAIQFIGNLMYALTQPYVTKGAEDIGDLFAHKLVSIIVQVVVEIVVATVETVRDMLILCNGGSVVPFKILTDKGSDKEWKSKFESPTDIASWDIKKDTTVSDAKKVYAFSYKDYLWMFLCIKCINENGRYEVLTRAADLAQVNIKKSEKLDTYSLMKEYTMLKVDADVKMDTWLVTNIFHTEEIGIDTSGTFTLDYKGVQGY